MQTPQNRAGEGFIVLSAWDWEKRSWCAARLLLGCTLLDNRTLRGT
jgi:hypothetical protein